ncbi:MAG TPA: DUF72 domain-containing protein [bacterium]|nr:DUF72 domain-containing protein [bacterium]
MAPSNLFIGTSGWTYPWRGIFYPEDLPSADFLPFYARHFTTTEVNSSFYHFTMLKTIEKWRAQTPDTFRIAAKLHRSITHEHRLHDVEAPLRKWMDRFLTLGPRLGPILIQLPASFRFEAPRALAFFQLLRQLYPDPVFALEVRHKSWLEEEPLDLLREFSISWVIAHSPRWPILETTTTDTIYLRLHGEQKLYSGPYSDDLLERFGYMIHDWLLDGRQVWVFFNNTIGGAAVHDATRLASLLANL